MTLETSTERGGCDLSPIYSQMLSRGFTQSYSKDKDHMYESARAEWSPVSPTPALLLKLLLTSSLLS